MCIDQGRAYTDHLAKLSVVPVFGLFDNFRPVDKDAPIEPLARYLVNCPQRDKILLEKRTDVLFGFSVEYAREADIRLSCAASIGSPRVTSDQNCARATQTRC